MTKNFFLIFPDNATELKDQLNSRLPEWQKETDEDLYLFTEDNVQNYSLIANVHPCNIESCTKLFVKIANEFQCDFFEKGWEYTDEEIAHMDNNKYHINQNVEPMGSLSNSEFVNAFEADDFPC